MKDYFFKARDGGNKEFLSMLIYRPIAGFMLEKFFRDSKVTPNQISLMSLVVIAAGCCFFAFCPYPWNITGVLLLHFGYALDMLDGIYARYRGVSSEFGRWLDAFFDVIKGFLLFTSLAYSAYVTSGHYLILIAGMAALANTFLTFYVLNTKEHVIKEVIFEVQPWKGIYIGYEIMLYCFLSLMVVFDKIYLGLIILATFGALAWLKNCRTIWIYHLTHKETVKEA
ncbi:MAG: CDP-alcohol phosphatidyltransferase family protein [Candidatus Omnitrophica bacterium]|nr:CDP-alcohol phosphatidyltransferase family protein [Candidatus Omnitrophota bacterium]